MPEQDLISQFFERPNDAPNVSLSIGDDAALTTLPPGYELASSIDTLVCGVNFPKTTHPEDIAYKAMAVSLSDIAAMGAEPKTTLLSLTIPDADKKWLGAFSKGLFELIDQYHMQLIGGDMTKGPLSITTVVNGFVPIGKALKRCSAQVDDAIYVTGTLGDAGMALTKDPDLDCLQQLNRPTPRIEAGIALRDIASATIDLSDGLATDLEKLCQASHVGANIKVDKIRLNKAPIALALSAGDDFELCFTVPPQKEAALKTLNLDCGIQKIGNITAEKTVNFIQPNGQKMELKHKGYEHF